MTPRPTIVALSFGVMLSAQEPSPGRWEAEQGAHVQRLATVRDAAIAGDTTCIPDLLAILAADTYPSIRHTTVDLLGRLRDPRVFPALHRELPRDQDSGSRRRIVAALGRCGDPRSLPVLEDLLADRGLRAEAAAALGVLGDPRAWLPLEEVWTRTPDVPDLQLQGARALLQLDAGRALPLVLARLASDPQAAEPLASAVWDREEPAVRDVLRTLLAAPQAHRRTAAFSALLETIVARGGDEADAAALMGYWQRLDAGEAEHRQWVALALGHTKSKVAPQWACVALQREKDHATKARLLEALGRMREPRAVAAIAPFLYTVPTRVLTCGVRHAAEYVPLHLVAAWSIATICGDTEAGRAEMQPWGFSPDVNVADSEPARAWWELSHRDPRWSFAR